MEIKSKEIKLVDINSLKFHPKNCNKHSEKQIQRLMEIIRHQGFRNPIVVSNLSGYVVSGNGRLISAIKLGMKEVPVIYQDFKTNDEEYLYLVSDNAIAEWSELDLSMINDELQNFDPSTDLDLLGIEDFELEPADKFTDCNERNKTINQDKCPSCGYDLSKDENVVQSNT